MGKIFKPNGAGFREMLNSPGVQSACLRRAQDVAAIAGGMCGVGFSTDVRPGVNRCHARATVNTHMQLTADEFYHGKFTEVRQAGAEAARMVGGEGRVGTAGKTLKRATKAKRK